MPHKQAVVLKYKCVELRWNEIICEDKWLQHRHGSHEFKMKRVSAIKCKTVQYKENGGKWLDFASDSQPTVDSTAQVANEMTSFQPVFLACQDNIDLSDLLTSSQQKGAATAEDADAIIPVHDDNTNDDHDSNEED